MAKRKKKHHHKRKHRRGVGAINTGGLLMQVAGVAAGAFAAQALNKAVGPKVPSKLLNFGMIGAGALLLPKLIKGPIGSSVGMGMIAVGTIASLQSFGVLNGVGADDTLVYAVNGTGDERNLIGDSDDDAYHLSGDDDIAGVGDELSMIAGLDED